MDNNEQTTDLKTMPVIVSDAVTQQALMRLSHILADIARNNPEEKDESKRIES